MCRETSGLVVQNIVFCCTDHVHKLPCHPLWQVDILLQVVLYLCCTASGGFESFAGVSHAVWQKHAVEGNCKLLPFVAAFIWWPCNLIDHTKFNSIGGAV